MFRSANWMQIQEFSWEHIGNSDTLWFQPISTEIHSSLEWTRDEALQCRSVTSTAAEFFDSGWTIAKLSSLGVHLYFFSPHAEGYLRGRLVLWTGFKEKLPPCFFWLCPPFDKFGDMFLDELYHVVPFRRQKWDLKFSVALPNGFWLRMVQDGTATNTKQHCFAWRSDIKDQSIAWNIFLNRQSHIDRLSDR